MMSMALIGMVKLVIMMMAKMTLITHNDTMNDTKSSAKQLQTDCAKCFLPSYTKINVALFQEDILESPYATVWT